MGKFGWFMSKWCQLSVLWGRNRLVYPLREMSDWWDVPRPTPWSCFTFTSCCHCSHASLALSRQHSLMPCRLRLAESLIQSRWPYWMHWAVPFGHCHWLAIVCMVSVPFAHTEHYFGALHFKFLIFWQANNSGRVWGILYYLFFRLKSLICHLKNNLFSNYLYVQLEVREW